jgi:hypothetical protein
MLKVFLGDMEQYIDLEENEIHKYNVRSLDFDMLLMIKVGEILSGIDYQKELDHHIFVEYMYGSDG